MRLFTDLRSEYPLNLTFFERPCAPVLKQSYRAGLPTARAITVLLISPNCWCPSQLLVDRDFDAQHYSGTNGLDIDEKLVPLVESWRASPCGNNGPYSYALTLSSFSPNSALYAVAAVHLLSTSGAHSPITTVFCPGFQVQDSTQGVHFGSITSSVPVRGQQGKSDQLRRST
jgi:hypothetical protein